ncbi:MAG: hypothetical protein GY703_17550 [Gammaproteobacteria bacterium]|nr:hypothetical protein [Gammaproteobacteria bacterium]
MRDLWDEVTKKISGQTAAIRNATNNFNFEWSNASAMGVVRSSLDTVKDSLNRSQESQNEWEKMMRSLENASNAAQINLQEMKNTTIELKAALDANSKAWGDFNEGFQALPEGGSCGSNPFSNLLCAVAVIAKAAVKGIGAAADGLFGFGGGIMSGIMDFFMMVLMIGMIGAAAYCGICVLPGMCPKRKGYSSVSAGP